MRKVLLAAMAAVLFATTFTGSSAHADPDPEIGTPVSAILIELDRFDNSGDDSIFIRCAPGETKVFTFDVKIKDGVDATFTQLRRNKMFLKLKSGQSLKARARTLDQTKRWVSFSLFDAKLGPNVRPDKRAMNGGTLIFKGSPSYDDIEISTIGAYCVTFNPVFG